MPKAIREVRAQLRDFALGLPEAHEDLPWGERVVKVNKKVFVFLGRDLDAHFGLGVKLPTSKLQALRLPFTEPTGYGLGKSGWVSAKLDDKSQASFEMLRDWVKESYCAVAPKGLAAKVGSEASHAKSAKNAAKQPNSVNQVPKSTSARAGAKKRAPKR